MAGISATLSREDLKFMAEDIGPELVQFLDPEDVLKGMDAEKQRRLISLFDPKQLLDNMNIEELLKGISPEQRKTLFELLSKMLAASLADKAELNGNSSNN